MAAQMTKGLRITSTSTSAHSQAFQRTIPKRNAVHCPALTCKASHLQHTVFVPALALAPVSHASRQHRQQRQARSRHPHLQPRSAADGTDPSTSHDLDPNVPVEDQDFDLLSNQIAALTEQLNEEMKGCSIYLVGMMGSGKSTVGKMLANTFRYEGRVHPWLGSGG